MNLSLEDAKVLVIGDIMLDRYWEGSAQRISPEAPVPVVHVKNTEERAGGAGNVALNITSLSGSADLIGFTGDDEAAKRLEEILNHKQVTTDFIKTGLPTITKLRVMAQHQQLLRMDFEEGFHQLNKDSLVDHLESKLEDINAIILSDYGKGALSDPQSLIKLARNHQIPVLIDPKGNNFEPYRGATVITPNMKEFEAVVGRCHSETEIEEKALNLVKKIELDALLVTRSEKGMMLVHRSGEVYKIPTKAKEVFDVTGAGDTVIAVMGMALAVGYSYEEAINFANTAAGIVVGKLGAATVTLPELYHALHKVSHIKEGIVSEKEVKLAIKQAHLQGDKVVFTNGCFDILHKGHVDYLQKAKKLGDRLIVAVNTDESVRHLKGNERPIVALNERMEVLSALECVDWVVAFKEETPQRLISYLLPDILVKGADYEIDEIAGAKEVLENGGEVKTISLVEGCSTSSIVEKIKSLSR